MKKLSCLPTILMLVLLGVFVALGQRGVLIGYFGGAVLGALIGFVKWPMFWKEWRIIMPFLLVDSAARCAFLGSIAGFVAGVAYNSGNVVGAQIAIAVAVVACWFRVPRQPRESDARPPAPMTENQRARWASELSARFSEDEGLSFANSMHNQLVDAPRLWKKPVRAVLLASDYRRAHALLISEVDRAAAGAYGDSDKGWRWEVVTDEPPHIRVSPDPLLQRDGPVFDVHRDWIVKRERVGLPGLSVDRSLVSLQRLRAELIETSVELRAAGKWNGEAGTLLDALVEALRGHPSRANLVEPKKEGTWTWFKVAWGGAHAVMTGFFRPVEANTTTPYHLKTIYSGTSYMVDEHGRWHMALGEATVNDPPPPPFMLDPSIPVP